MERILDTLLTSVTPLQILIGKLLGVAAVSLTLFLFWGALGGTLLTLAAERASDNIFGQVAAAFLDPRLLTAFVVGFVAGYLLYGAIFLALGSLCESVQEAQTLLGDARVSDLCVWTRAGYDEAVARAAERIAPGIVATTRAQTRAAIEHAANRRSGGLSALLAPVLALALASFAALSWFAHARRATEIAAYKLCGFSGGDILFLAVIENAIVACVIGSAAFLCAWIFVRVFNAPLLAAYLIPDLALFPTQRIPATFTPLPLGLGLALAFSATLAGSIFATWRLSIARTAKAFA